MNQNSLEQMVPDDVLVRLIEIGQVAKSAGMVNHAERLFQHLCYAYPLRTFPHMCIAFIYIQKNLYAKACDEFEEIISISGGDKDIYLWCGICHYECGRYAKAYEVLNKIISSTPMGDLSEVRAMAEAIMNNRRMVGFSSRRG